MPKPLTLQASPAQRAALAARMTKTAPPPEPPKPSEGNRVSAPKSGLSKPQQDADLNAAQIAGRARRAAQWERQHRAAVVRERLIALYPLCFKPSGQTMVPLKLRIHMDIAAALPDVSKNDIGLALESYARTREYRTALIEGAWRVDLDGHQTSQVSASEVRSPQEKAATPESQRKSRQDFLR